MLGDAGLAINSFPTPLQGGVCLAPCMRMNKTLQGEESREKGVWLTLEDLHQRLRDYNLPLSLLHSGMY